MSDEASTNSTIQKISPMHVHALGAIGVLMLGGLAYAFGVAPSLKAQAQAQAQREAIARAGDRVRIAKSELEAAEASLETLRARDGVEPIASEQLVGRVTDITSQFGLTSLGTDRSGTERIGGLVRTRLTLNAMGSFSDIDAFLSEYRDHLPTATIEGFAIMPSPTSSGELALLATVLVYAPQSAPADSATAAATDSARSAAVPAR